MPTYFIVSGDRASLGPNELVDGSTIQVSDGNACVLNLSLNWEVESRPTELAFSVDQTHPGSEDAYASKGGLIATLSIEDHVIAQGVDVKISVDSDHRKDDISSTQCDNETRKESRSSKKSNGPNEPPKTREGMLFIDHAASTHKSFHVANPLKHISDQRSALAPSPSSTFPTAFALSEKSKVPKWHILFDMPILLVALVVVKGMQWGASVREKCRKT